MAQWVILLLLPFAVWSGWHLAMRKEQRKLRLEKLRVAYTEGLNYLLDNQTEKAVNSLLNLSHYDRDNVESELTLGVLFRKRGDVDRALHIHQQLLNKKRHTPEQYARLLLELGEDYRSAGMYHQAREVLEELVELRQDKAVYHLLIELYERSCDWQLAYEMAERWQDHGYGSKQIALANYACELAIKEHECGCTSSVQGWLDKALQHHGQSVRAYWLKGSYALLSKEYRQAVSYFERTIELNPNMIVDVLPYLRESYVGLHANEEYKRKLEYVSEQTHHARVISAVVREFRQLGDEESARQILMLAMGRLSTPLLIRDCYDEGVHEQIVTSELLAQLSPQTVYQCGDCGYKQVQRCWHCPSCHGWNTFGAVYQIHVEQR